MELGIGSYAYRWAIGIGGIVPNTPMTPADMVKSAHGYGVSLVQLADNVKLDRASPATLAALEASCDETGVRLELGHNSLRPGLIGPYLDLAQRFDVGLIRIAPDTEDAEASFDEIVEGLRSLLPRLKSQGVVLAIENHFHFTSPYLRQIVEAVNDPHVGVCLDVANSIAVGEWPAETIGLLAPFAVNLHLKDYQIEIDPHGVGMSVTGVPLGEGRFAPETVLQALSDNGRDVNVILEHWLPLSGGLQRTISREEEWLGRSVSFANQLLAKQQSLAN